MTKRRFTPVYPAELRERGVLLLQENRADYASDSAAYRAIAPKLGGEPLCDVARLVDLTTRIGLPVTEAVG
ncbi:hypothetical protein C8N32_1403 [Rhodovulum imhoffii]|uniref:Uncharacterized protein n=1 Tax=Rhodovulum imhoffii TaxID=365340 RepID=A0A2T5BL23_9RHOB|nr:hypothetical protein C8N32_1403 [Rhodovulum imhoffii]